MTNSTSSRRFHMVSSRPFRDVEATLSSAIGRPDLKEFVQAMTDATSFEALTKVVDAAAGPSGLMEFARFELGSVLRFDHAGTPPRILRLIVGNPLVMKQMLEVVRDTGSYAPVTLLIDERADGVHLSYYRMGVLLAPYGAPKADAVATALDAKIEALLTRAATQHA